MTAEHAQTEIAWTPDGGRVAFLVNGYQLSDLRRAHGRQSSRAVDLVEPDGSPSSRIARGVDVLRRTAPAVTFDEFSSSPLRLPSGG